jgi:minimal PKS acyl carrier protein
VSDFSMTELKEIMRAGAGVPDDVDLDGDIADIEFDELGYDSLALLELISQFSRRYGVSIPDEALTEMPTPARALCYLNDHLARAEA